MNVGVLKVNSSRESRVPLIPEHAKKMVNDGISLSVESGIGLSIDIQDKTYEEVGVTIVKDRKKLLSNSDFILGLEILDVKDVKLMKENAFYAGMLNPFYGKELITTMAKQGVSTFCMEMIPRSTRAQKMDVLSSQASLAGYVAVIIASEKLDKILPMMMTPAGTLKPSRVFIIGAGVAGLQAIATAKRLGARVEAFDMRPVVKEEVQSLGAKFIEIDLGETGQTKDGYAKALTKEQIKIQQEGMAKVCSHSDIVITTAQLFGRKAPLIITKEMIQGMQPGSVIIDLAVETGGNVAGSKVDEVVEMNGVRIVGTANLPGMVPLHASQMYSSNLYNFISEFWDKKEKTFKFNQEDEIISSCLITHQKEITNEMLKEKYAS